MPEMQSPPIEGREAIVDRARLVGAVVGGLAAGLGITAVLMLVEKRSSRPSELVLLGRAAARKQGFGTPSDSELPSSAEQAAAQSGHLLLSGLIGAAFALAVPKNAAVIGSGVYAGLAVYGALQWIAGPLLGLKKPEWQSAPATIAMHTVNHLGFGIITAASARWAARRWQTS